jgi:hypothetical protein
MKRMIGKLHPGDLVEIKLPDEILQTLDDDGTVDQLPFMPEMILFCGKRFRVSRRAVKTCWYGQGSGMRRFPAEDVVLLDGVRCSGANHDGCQKACNIFWREAWLRKIENSQSPSLPVNGTERLRARLKTIKGPNKYFCQSSEILNATVELSKVERFSKCVDEVRSRNAGISEVLRRIGVWTFWKARRLLSGPYAKGKNQATPAQSLNLQPGESVEVKPLKSIRETLDQKAHNRGLFFTPSMSLLCGQRRKVDRKIEKIIVDGTGEMRNLRNTVFLEGELCECSCVAFGGCPRGEFSYWREIWLKRTEPSNKREQELSVNVRDKSDHYRDSG